MNSIKYYNVIIQGKVKFRYLYFNIENTTSESL